MSPSHLNKVLRGSEPGARKALQLARRLEVPLDWLVDDEADWPPPQDKESELYELLRSALDSIDANGPISPDEAELLSAYRSLPDDVSRAEIRGRALGMAGRSGELSEEEVDAVRARLRRRVQQAEEGRRGQTDPAPPRRAAAGGEAG